MLNQEQRQEIRNCVKDIVRMYERQGLNVYSIAKKKAAYHARFKGEAHQYRADMFKAFCEGVERSMDGNHPCHGAI